MIQDFSNVFVGKQMVRSRQIPVREGLVVNKTFGLIVAGALATGILASVAFGLMIRAGQHELAAQSLAKQEMLKEQQEMHSQRNTLLNQNTLARTAGKLGLYTPDSRQIRHL